MSRSLETIVLDESSNDSKPKRASPQTDKQEATVSTTSHQSKSSGNHGKSGHRIIQEDNSSFESVVMENAPAPVPVREEPKSGAIPKAVASSSSSSVPAKDSTNIVKDAKATVKKRRTAATLPRTEEFLTEETSEDEDTNPDMEFMKEVALMRAIVNNLLLNLRRSPFDFSRTRALEEFLEYYMQNGKADQETDK